LTTNVTIVKSFWSVVALALLGSIPQWSLACTRDDAFNSMMALNQYGMKLQAALPDPLKDPQGYEANYQRSIDFDTRLADVGKTLAAEKYDEACTTYAALAKDYGVDMAAQHVRPLSALESESAKPPKGGCDLAESARRAMWLNESFTKRADLNHLGRDERQAFGKENAQVGLLMQEDPSRACALIDRIATKYGFQRDLAVPGKNVPVN
jgi:hypothetical protein